MRNLFWSDPYLAHFEAKIVSVEANQLVLNQTAFYPESGGQIGDTGTIAGFRVLDTQYNARKEVCHTVDASADLGQINDQVKCEIDWVRRYRIMRHHSALHFLYLVLHEMIGDFKLRGSQVRDDKARLDIEFFGALDVINIEGRMNEISESDLPIEVEQMPGDDPTRRQWRVPGFETIPCGGTHVKATSEIGFVKVKRKKQGARGVRLYVAVG